MSRQGVVELSSIDAEIVGNSSGTDTSGYEQPSGLRARGRNVEREEDEDDYEDEAAVEQEPPTPEERKWALWVVLVSAVDMVISFVIIVIAFKFAYRSIGASLYSMGMQSISHWLSSVALMARFIGENSYFSSLDSSPASNSLLRRHRRRFLVREQILSVTMGCVMLISSAALLFKAFRKMKFWHYWYKDHLQMDSDVAWATEFLAWYGFSVYLLIAIFRFAAARKLRRSILWHGFVASVVSLVFLMVLGLAASYEKEWSWKAEPIAAIFLAFVSLAEGVRIIIMHLDDMDTRMRFDPRA